MKLIPLTQGEFAQVDNDLFDDLNKFKWCIQRGRNTSYAISSIGHGKLSRRIYMHRLIMELRDQSLFIDHKDRNGLNNQIKNLRICTASQNSMNRTSSVGNSTFKGVSYRDGGYNSQIKVGGSLIIIGKFSDEIEAAKQYDKAAIKYHGEFACLNFPKKSGRMVDYDKKEPIYYPSRNVKW